LCQNTQERIKDCTIQISWNFKTQTKREGIKTSTRTQIFYTDSLKFELHLICQGSLSLTCTISKDFHNPQDYTFKISENTTKTFESYKSLNKHNKITLVDLENHKATPRNLINIKPEWRLSLANQTFFSKFLNQAKFLQERSKINHQ